jgi:multiple sugar transport system ATP-binding protein
MASVTLSNVSKYYGQVCATRDLSFRCDDGQMIALLGPSGCGKTSTLKMIAGIEDISEGEIFLDQRLVNGLSPGARNIAMVFEDYALYPNMSVSENIAFPLKLRRWPEREIRRKIDPVLELLDLHDQKDSNVRRLSGGAQQRVSIGRALVREPELIIFDEPLSHLDADQKVQLRIEIRRLQKATGLTGILVTHDQTEAIAMADKVAVMNHGELQQIADPQTLYDHPANLFVANFIGEPPMNLLPIQLAGNGTGLRLLGADWSLEPGEEITHRIGAAAQGKELILGVRPELIRLSSAVDGKSSSIEGTITWREYRGDNHVLTVTLPNDGSEIIVEAREAWGLAGGLEVGVTVSMDFPDAALNVFDAADGRNLLSEALQS